MTGNYVDVGGTRIRYRERPGTGVPILFIHGKKDTVLPTKHSIDAQAITPNSKLMMLDGCGHTPQLEKPEIFNQALAGFVEA